MLAGPYAGMVLADLGAEVVKVEPLGSGEMTRGLLKNDPNYSFKNFSSKYASRGGIFENKNQPAMKNTNIAIFSILS